MQVSFVIPVFNQTAHTRACLDALQAHMPASTPHEIIVVDDGSAAETRAFLQTRADAGAIRLIVHPANRGFARATNAGAAIATGRWLCLLNNDVELTPGAMSTLLAATEARPDAAIIGNIQLTTATGEVDHAGIDFVDGGYPLHRRGELAALQAAGDIVAVPAATAACCLVDRDWFQASGGFDERYTNGFEDVDLCLRARENGLGVYVATRSVVKHAVSLSEGRGRHEFRNARKFLARWGARTAAIERAERAATARRYRLERARTATSAPASVAAARQAELDAEVQRIQRETTPATVWVDLLRMVPGGANGGIKPFVFSFLRELTQTDAPPQRYVVFVRENVAAEISFLRPSDVVVAQSEQGWTIRTGGTAPTTRTLAEIENRFPPEVLYCPFATSSFSRAGLPSVALMVDTLHRDLPSALPIEEVNFREDWFKRVLGSATWLQCNSHHVTERLHHHFGVPVEKCFHTYNAVHARFAAPSETTDAAPFFFYPANFWPHKNHEVLLTAYRLYRYETGAAAWPLILTGHPDERMRTLQEMATRLGLDGAVSFRGHVDDAAFARLWQTAGALVFPSLHEGFGIPLLEAFHHGVPVLAARASALPEVGGEACAWFDPRDPGQLADAMTALTADPARRAALAEAGQQRLQRFSLRFEARRLHHFLHAAARGLVP